MTEITEYQAFTNQGFLLREAVLVSHRLLANATINEIRREVLEDDLLDLRASKSRATVIGALASRLAQTPASLLRLLAESDLETKRLVNFYLILRQHRLLRDFMAEVLVNQLQALSLTVPQAEIQAFFHRKQAEVPEIRAWAESTYQKSRSNITAILEQAGLLVKSEVSSDYVIRPPFVPIYFKEELRQLGHDNYLVLLLDRS